MQLWQFINESFIYYKEAYAFHIIYMYGPYLRWRQSYLIVAILSEPLELHDGYSFSDIEKIRALINMIWRSPDCSFDISDTRLYKQWTSNVDVCDIRNRHFAGHWIDATSTNYERLITVEYTIIRVVLMALQTRTRKRILNYCRTKFAMQSRIKLYTANYVPQQNVMLLCFVNSSITLRWSWWFTAHRVARSHALLCISWNCQRCNITWKHLRPHGARL